MELDQWLVVYHAIVGSALSKERTAWTIFLGGLIAQAVLLIPLVFLASTGPWTSDELPFAIAAGICVLGAISSLAWILARLRSAGEADHMASLCRGLEGQFAGGEFVRSLHRFSRGEKVCISSTEWTCDEWLPSVSRMSTLPRVLSGFFVRLTPLAFLLGWIGVLVDLLML